MPVVSVILPVYNGERFLREAIDSILSQTFRDFELIVIDDGSIDSSPSILAECTRHDKRVHVHMEPRNRGLVDSLNLGLRMAQGKYIARMDADDISLPDRLARQVDYLEINPEIGVLGTQMRIIDQLGATIGQYALPVSHNQIAWALMFESSFAHPTVMMQKRLLERAGGYNPLFYTTEDHELWTRLLWDTRFANLQETFLCYRSHHQSTSSTHADIQRANVLLARQILVSRVLEKKVSLEMIDWMAQSQVLGNDLPDDVIEQVISTIVDIFNGFCVKGLFDVNNLSDAYLELARKIMIASRFNTRLTKKEADKSEDLYFHIKKIIPSPIKKLGRKLLRGQTKQALPAENTQKIKPPFVKSEDPVSGISIIVLSYERMRSLELMLGSLLEQKLDGISVELIICNNSPRFHLSKSHFSNIGRMLRKFPDARIINSSHNWRTHIRYSLATLAKNKTVLFLDDDFILRDSSFISYMFKTFCTLGPLDILSCWNTLWVEWTADFLSVVSLTFHEPQITEVTKSDVAGPGICMFNKQILTPNVLKGVMPTGEYSRADDMAFSLAAYLEHQSQTYYLPSYGMIEYHVQSKKNALYAQNGHYTDLYALYKAMLNRGYKPVMSRSSSLANNVTPEKKVVELIEQEKFSW